MKKTFFSAVIALFLILGAFFMWLEKLAPEFDLPALMVGNIVMAALVSISFFLVSKQSGAKAAAFVRSVYSSTFLKLSVCLIAVVSYALIKKTDVHKPSLFVLFGIYAVYTIIETWLLAKMARQKN